jgi:hypothetical protein
MAGRVFDQNDRRGGSRVAIVNEAFVRQLLPGQNPVGRRFEHGPNGPWREIIGVVEDGKYRSLSESPMPAVFEPMEQDYSPNNNLIARSALPEEQVTGMLRRAVMDLD